MFVPRTSTSMGTMGARTHDRGVTFARNDENVVVSNAKNLAGTPQSTKSSKHRSKIPQPSGQRRRALGDISNKKKGLGGGGGGFGSASKKQGGAAGASPSTSKLRIQTDGLTPRRLPLQPRQQQGNNSNRKPSPTSSLVQPKKSISKSVARLPPRSGIASSTISSIPRPTSLSTARKPKSRVVEFTLPQQASLSSSSVKASKLGSESVKSLKPKASSTYSSEVQPNNGDSLLEPVDDIELPAGRLWSEQVALEDQDDSSFQEAYKEGMEEMTTMWDDWRYIMVDQLEEQRRKQEEADTKADAAYEEEMFEKYKCILDEDGTSMKICLCLISFLLVASLTIVPSDFFVAVLIACH